MQLVTVKFLQELLANDQPEDWQLATARHVLRNERAALERWRDLVQAKRKAKRAERIANEG